MQSCAICLNLIPDHVDRCPFCGSDFELDEPFPVDQAIEWTIIRTVNTDIEARILAGRLRAEGIPAFVLSQVDTTRGFTIGALAVAKVFVPEHLCDEAEQILQTEAE
ncbi:MAG: DUF2007 domain-containing protein [Armatimonadetes bacterium]|nr:DUF2007 domain-containing protein [Armatimonadota bacterium]